MNEFGKQGPPEVYGSKRELLLLLMVEAANAEKLAKRLRFHVSVVRRHLEEMKASSLVDATFKKRSRGRPNKIYSITVEGRESLGSNYRLLLELVAEALTDRGGDDLSRKVFSSAAKSLAQSVHEGDATDNIILLGELGFEPERRNEAGQIVSRNCPILKVARKYPELTCDTFHTIFLREFLHDPGVTLRQAISRGSRECVHELKLNQAPAL